jgi:phytoene dehydrogenase-like protein
VADVIVVGAGHNGLTAAYYLARAGLHVTVLEAQDAVGGACKTEELVPGFRFSTCATRLWSLRARVAEDMKLFERGLVAEEGPRSRILEGNRPFVWWPDDEDLLAEIGRISSHDANVWPEWRALWTRAADLIGPFLLSHPPTLAELLAFATERGEQDLLATLMTSSVAELAAQFFESAEMRSSMGTVHDIGSLWDHGSALAMAISVAMETYSETGRSVPQGFVRGGMGQVTRLMAQAVEELGVTIRTKAAVEQIMVEDGDVVGVALTGGEQVIAGQVLSSADVKRTFLRLLSPRDLPARLVTRVNGLRTDIAPLKLHCALNQLPEWSAFEASEIPSMGPLTIKPSADMYEGAWDDARHGRLPKTPFMVAMTPTRWDASLAPASHHTVSFWILFAPVRPASGTWSENREEMAGLLLDQIDHYSPNFRSALLDYVLLTPADLEERVLLTDGNIHHVDMSLSQMFWQRPLPELSRYRTPVGGLYLCGSGQHPSGEVTGAPGHNCAHAVLEDLALIEPSGWEERRKYAHGSQVTV